MFRKLVILLLLTSSVLCGPIEKTAVANRANRPNQTSVDAKDETGLTPLMQAAWDGESDKVKKLLQSGADPKIADQYGWTALNYAVAMGHGDVTKSLVTGGATVNSRDRREMTPLMWSALGKKSDVVTALLARGADVNASTKNGATAYSFALAKRNSGITKTLRQAGGSGPQIAETDLPEAIAPVDRQPKFLGLDQALKTVLHAAMEQKPRGVISLRVLVGLDGTVRQVKLIKKLEDVTTAAVIRTTWGLRANPAENDGHPVEYWYALRYTFT